MCIGGAEDGSRPIGADVLDRALAVAGLTLAPVPRLSELTEDHVAWLLMSTSDRLLAALGGSPPARRVRTGACPAWDELAVLAGYGDVELVGSLALAIWLPGAVPTPAPVAVRLRTGSTLPEVRLLDPVPTELVSRLRRVPVGISTNAVVHVRTPLALAAGVAPGTPGDQVAGPSAARDQAALLRAVAAALDADARADLAGRRASAHREPDLRAERWRVLTTHALGSGRHVPDPRDARSWRLGGAPSLRVWLRDRGEAV